MNFFDKRNRFMMITHVQFAIQIAKKISSVLNVNINFVNLVGKIILSIKLSLKVMHKILFVRNFNVKLSLMKKLFSNSWKITILLNIYTRKSCSIHSSTIILVLVGVQVKIVAV